MESLAVATYPSAGGRRMTHGCVFQERNTREVATNVYLRKTSEKSEKTWKTNAFSTCFYTSFLSRDFPFYVDSLHTCSYSHLDFHTRHLFTEIAYQVTQVPREFDTWFLPFYTTCAIWCTC